MTERIDCIVIGAGVVGLAVAREMALAGLETIVLERNKLVGAETSSRNSEVIHAGIHYPPGSLRARLCIEGRDRLYEYCTRRGIDHSRCGKLVVATRKEQVPRLAQIIANAEASGVHDLEIIDANTSREYEPELACLGSVFSPSSGIVDSHGLMMALQGDLEANGGMVALSAPAIGGTIDASSRYPFKVDVSGEDGMQLESRYLVNSAGHHADEFAQNLKGMPADLVPKVYFAKGNYFSLSGKAPFSRLIYPVPGPVGLGVHFTLDLGGQAKFGPDVQWVDELRYEVDESRLPEFYDRVREYWPGLPDGSLMPDYSGIRPKLHGPGQPSKDFLLQDASLHGISGLVNLLGIDSPGLTSCMAIAAEVRRRNLH